MVKPAIYLYSVIFVRETVCARPHFGIGSFAKQLTGQTVKVIERAIAKTISCSCPSLLASSLSSGLRCHLQS